MIRFPANFRLLLGSLLFALLLGEGAARLLTRTDEDGQAWLGSFALLPYRFPAATTRAAIERYLRLRDQAYIVRDPQLGWDLAPNAVGGDGLYRTNAAGLRSPPREYAAHPPPGVVRVALFGDSFTHGDEEPWEKYWGAFLEEELNASGRRAEVLNFGVPGYGVGQAYLRWLRDGTAFHPDIAVFGFQPENMRRTVNVFRQLYSRSTGMIFSKPRFRLTSSGTLEAVNLPILPLEEVPAALERLPSIALGAYEYWYRPDHYRDCRLYRSRLAALIVSALFAPGGRPGGDDDHGPGLLPEAEGSEGWEVTRTLLEAFAASVREEGAVPVIVHIPDKPSLKEIEAGRRPPYLDLLDELAARGVPVCDPAAELARGHKFYKHAHLSSRGGRALARFLARELERYLDAGEGTAP
ncbi:MAG TPA: SGNH/GDSL hydrolase family protein [bacterium]|nr:SGNH/GDSL hydrolase family protein [bacterium]HPJ71642.1 SGNH/GDSL hydrolase family protein [bacterium]HPQ65668.1 SGNH/GDSL hydrolase family protein [bacterium]